MKNIAESTVLQFLLLQDCRFILKIDFRDSFDSIVVFPNKFCYNIQTEMIHIKEDYEYVSV